MPDPNDTLKTIQMLSGDIAKSKTALGYDSELMRRLGTWVFGSLDAVRDAIQAPDGQTWRSGMFAEAEKRGNLAEAFDAIEKECWSLKCESYPTGGGDADVGWEVISHHMAKPHERVEGMGKTPLAAIEDAFERARHQQTGAETKDA